MTEAMGDESIRVFDPRGEVAAETIDAAPRPASMAGLRLGVLDNTKWNAGRLLRATVARLEAGETAPAQVRHYAKESFSRPADPALIRQIASECDVVLTAIGD